MSGAGCCVAATCSISAATASVVLVALTETRVAAIGAFAEDFLSPDIAPAVPPPRA
jgi:hypothetical protein